MNVFVSGGAGFIGSHLVRHLLGQADVDTVVVYDNFSSGTASHLDGVRNDNRLKVVNADIKHLGELTHAMRGSDTIFHLAANPDIAKAVRFPDVDFWEGTYLTQNILEAMRLNGASRIFYTSGSGVYGDVPGKEFDEGYGPCFPISTYGASKLACEALISSYCHMFGMFGRAFRFANVVGPRQTHGVGYDFIRRLRSDPRTLRILGDGSQRKSYIHVDDVVAAVLMVERSLERMLAFDVNNVATDDYITVTQIADICCEVAGLDRSAVDFAYTGGDRGWKGDVPQVLFDVSKIKRLGWRAERSSAEAIRASVSSMHDELECLSRARGAQ
jgi:UDP-glucose 4-epimerase